MHICIVGAGAAGLASARQAQDSKYKHTYTVFEQTGQIGGTWVYDDRTGDNEYGLPIHTSMYKNLRTNLPKEVMGYPDYAIPDYNKSYITQQQILDFLCSYADFYKINSNIKFYHYVKLIEPQENEKWQVTVTDLKTKMETIHIFDGIMICNGHYNTPYKPNVIGSNIFKGLQIHSHDFRDPEIFRDKKVLVVGAGPSGMDIALQISDAATQVILSHESKDEIATKFPKHLIQQTLVKYLAENKVVFKNGFEATIDVIIYCTGFLYNFPFLSKKCNVNVVNNHVQPLYKQLLNINHPTMCFIGLPFYVCAFSMFDLQARFYFEYLSGRFALPSKQEMMDEMKTNIDKLLKEGYQDKHAHMLGPKQDAYYQELSSLAQIKPIPPVLTKLHNESSRRFLEDLPNYREDVYKIVNDETFVQVL